MNQDEFSRCIALLDGYWPHGTRSWTADSLEIWEGLLMDLDYRPVGAAIQTLAVDGREFPPPPGLIRRRTLELTDPLPGADQAWREVKSQLSRGREPTYSNPIVKQAVDTLGGWHELGMSTNGMADRAHFLKLYAEMVERQRTVEQLPPAAREVLTELGAIVPAALPEPPEPECQACHGGGFVKVANKENTSTWCGSCRKGRELGVELAERHAAEQNREMTAMPDLSATRELTR